MKNLINFKKNRPGAFSIWLISLCVLLLAPAARAQTFLTNNNLNSTIAPGEYYHTSSITLSNGFDFAASTGNSLHLYILSSSANCVPLATVLSSDQNYVSTIILRQKGFLTNGQLTGLTTCQAMQTIQYVDGLGRPLQMVTVKGNPDASKDMIQPSAYDPFGREAVKYLPYTTATGNPGSYRSDALTGAQNSFYQLTGQNYKDIANPFSQTVFEPSPLNRTNEQGAPGTVWQPSTSRTATTGRTMVMQYTNNNRTPLTDTANTKIVAFYKATINSNGSRILTRTGDTATYLSAELNVTITKDENWTAGRGGTVEEYKDMDGKVVLKRTFDYKSGVLQMLSTYYVYDDMEDLAFVLPPGANPDAGSPVTQTTLNNFCYQYRYDERNRMTEKRLPGKGWDFTVYNQQDNVVATQDSVQRSNNQWIIAKYNTLGQVLLTGMWNNSNTAISRTSLQANVYAGTQLDSRDYTNMTTGYNITSYPATLNSLLTINYYDDYNIPGLPGTYDQHTTSSSMTRGQLTATKTAILNTDGSISSQMLWTVHYFDNKGRMVKAYAQHYLGGAANYNTNNYDALSTHYDFTNEVIATTRQHYSAATLALTMADSMVYDHVGRKVQSWSKVNSGTNILLSKTAYNEVSQPYMKQLHSADAGGSFLQQITNSYNERGWLKNSSNSLFAMQLNYNDGTLAQYNGNIADQLWGTPGSLTKNYSYNYDYLDRLTAGTSGEGYTENGISYDPMGNITALTRQTNSYTYSYNGNQLTAVSGLTTGNYTYDGNGNMNFDARNGNNVSYNLMNLPDSVTHSGFKMTYTYDAAGNKLRKISQSTVTEYISGIQYTGTSMDFIQTEEGRILNPTTSPNYEYFLADHLGNSRVTFDSSSGGTTAKQTDDYYPFGLEISHGTVPSPKNEYLYNKKELQEETGQYDYGARFYDPVIARWGVIDPMGEKFSMHSPYAYVGNNPMKMVDPDGAVEITGAYGETQDVPANDTWSASGTIGIQYKNGSRQDFGSLQAAIQLNSSSADFIQSMYDSGGGGFDFGDGHEDPCVPPVVKNPKTVVRNDQSRDDKIANGVITALSGQLMMWQGIEELGATEGGAGFVSGSKIVSGTSVTGFGLAQIIDAYKGGKRDIPSGAGEAIDKGFGGNGSVGQVVDIVSAGKPKKVIDYVSLYFGIKNSNIYKSLTTHGNGSLFRNSFIMPVDNVRYSHNIRYAKH